MTELKTVAENALRLEAEAILDLIPRVDETFVKAVKMILSIRPLRAG